LPKFIAKICQNLLPKFAKIYCQNLPKFIAKICQNLLKDDSDISEVFFLAREKKRLTLSVEYLLGKPRT